LTKYLFTVPKQKLCNKDTAALICTLMITVNFIHIRIQNVDSFLLNGQRHGDLQKTLVFSEKITIKVAL
jgi:hypothetical protein